MLTKIFFFILGLWGLVFYSQENKQDELTTKPEIYIIGSIHSMHFDPNNHYSLFDLQTQISALKPDIVCGEITPDAFEQAMEGYFPPEAAFLAEMAPILNYRFVPVDWRLDYITQSKADSEYPISVKKQKDSLANKYVARLKESNNESIYDFFHDEQNLIIVDSLYEEIIGTNQIAEVAAGDWHERNRRIVKNGLLASKNAQKIVFVFGSDHIPGIKKQLKILGYEVQIPKRLFVPSNNFTVPEIVVERWKRNLENLKLIRDKKIPTSDDNYQKVINSKRIQDLELAIQKSS